MWGAFLTFTEDFHFAQNSPAAHLPSGAALPTGCKFPEGRLMTPLWDFQSQLAAGHSKGCMPLATFSKGCVPLAPKGQGSQATQGHRQSNV